MPLTFSLEDSELSRLKPTEIYDKFISKERIDKVKSIAVSLRFFVVCCPCGVCGCIGNCTKDKRNLKALAKEREELKQEFQRYSHDLSNIVKDGGDIPFKRKQLNYVLDILGKNKLISNEIINSTRLGKVLQQEENSAGLQQALQDLQPGRYPSQQQVARPLHDRLEAKFDEQAQDNINKFERVLRNLIKDRELPVNLDEKQYSQRMEAR